MSVNDTPRIVIYDYIVMMQIVASLTVDSRGVIYNHNMPIVQATDSTLSVGFINIILGWK
jgi:hypothetical protein